MRTLNEYQKFTYAAIAMIMMISLVNEPPTFKEMKALSRIIHENAALMRNYEYALKVKAHLEKALTEDFYEAANEIQSDLVQMNPSASVAKEALSVAVAYLKKNEKVTMDKISVLASSASTMQVPFANPPSFWSA